LFYSEEFVKIDGDRKGGVVDLVQDLKDLTTKDVFATEEHGKVYVY